MLVVSHHDSARVAGQAPRRFCGNVRTVLEDGLARLIRIRQGRRVDVHHDLVALSRSARIEPLMQRGFRDQGKRIRLLLSHRRRVFNAQRLTHGFAACVQRPHE
jgi:hypothetical protein